MPDGKQRKENQADMRAGRVNGVTTKGDSWSRRGPEGKGLENPGLGALSHRADQGAGPGGADRGEVTSGKHSEHNHGDRRTGSKSGYRETQADRRSMARGAGTRTRRSSTRPTTAWQRPQYAEE